MTQIRFYVGGHKAGGVPVTPEEWREVERVLRGFAPGWTLTHGEGYWEESKEPTRVYEVVYTTQYPLSAIQSLAGAAAKSMKDAARQRCCSPCPG